ncbi:11552_t:CDS:2 [Paraglomus brasilianum]|uniref:11552_t:CDS:1 n=1 Tax=Paraglomus brasilianum TaxID=144538 RepID=A0A9N8ZC29_9GLOM|nr:11552_t:CDS:2 [Paraglomus brasilianum]
MRADHSAFPNQIWLIAPASNQKVNLIGDCPSSGPKIKLAFLQVTRFGRPSQQPINLETYK